MQAGMDYDQALLTPENAFASPMDVVTNDALTFAQKQKILEQWEASARGVDVAQNEGMTGGKPSRLREVGKALEALEAMQ